MPPPSLPAPFSAAPPSDGHNHGHNFQPIPAYEGLLNRTTFGVLAAQAYSSPPERQQVKLLKSFGMRVPVGSNPTSSAKLG
jgi:hypothetical protein